MSHHVISVLIHISRTVLGTLVCYWSLCLTNDLVSPLRFTLVVLHNEKLYCVIGVLPRSWYYIAIQICLALMTDVSEVYIQIVNAHDPNGFQYSLFTSRIKLSTVNSCIHRYSLKTWHLGFLRVPRKHDIGAVIKIFIDIMIESLNLRFLYG